MLHQIMLICGIWFSALSLLRGQGDCPYPVLFVHGWTGNQSSFAPVYNNANFSNIWGNLVGIHHSVLNASTSTNIWGADGIPNNGDDDVLITFSNLSNSLPPGCVYAVNFENYWDENEASPQILINDGSSPSLFDADSNESAIYKQGYALKAAIEQVLLANPSKQKVLLVGHSMGGLAGREYLQRMEGGGPRWWVGFGGNGHGVAKLVTAATPHLGSNTLGNISFKPQDTLDHIHKDGLPDLASESVRDLRYSYACGLFLLDNCPAPYLYGGDEDDDIPIGFWNEDVNCDGDENDIIVGVNQPGPGDPWDGTRDNDAMPLPDNVRYTWVASNWLLGGDGVVDLDRQWLYTGNTPEPSDGTAHRRTDTMMTDLFHTSVNDDVNLMVRSMDEGDYPAHAWEILLNHPTPYAGMAQVRSFAAPEGPNTTDADWYRFTVPAGTTDDVCITVTPVSSLAGRVDYFSSPTSFTSLSTNASENVVFPSGSAPVEIRLSSGEYVAGGPNYVRIIHQGVGQTTWVAPFLISVTTKLPPVPVELVRLEAEQTKNNIRLFWQTATEVNNAYFDVQRAWNGRDFETIDRVDGRGQSTTMQSYEYIDERPLEGINYYRLRQVDFDGTSMMSPVVNAHFEYGKQPARIFPNPFSDELTFHILSDSEVESTVRVFDRFGLQITESRRAIRPGGQTIRIDTQSWPGGMYFAELWTGTDMRRYKLVKR